MPAAARIGDQTNHPSGRITGPALVPNVLIEGLPAAVLSDKHACATPQQGHLNSSALVSGSAKVFIGGYAATRVTDTAACGAAIVDGARRVEMG